MDPTPAQVMIDAAVGSGVWVRLTKGPATNCSGPTEGLRVRERMIVAVLPPVGLHADGAGEVVRVDAVISVAGTPSSGFDSVPVRGYGRACPTPRLSPAARGSV